MIGPVGLPAEAGGMSRHSEELYARLARLGVDVTVFVRKAKTATTRGRYRDMEVVGLWAPSRRGLETFVYGAIASLRALFGRFDVVHYQGVAAASFCWLQRLRPRRKLVITHHRQDWLDEKWGALARGLLRWTAAVSLRVADEVIAVSEDLAQGLRQIHNRPIEVIPNGVTLRPDGGEDALAALGLRPRRYVLTVGRIVPEKQVHMVVEAFERVKDESAAAVAANPVIGGIRSKVGTSVSARAFLFSAGGIRGALPHAALSLPIHGAQGCARPLEAMVRRYRVQRHPGAPRSPAGCGGFSDRG